MTLTDNIDREKLAWETAEHIAANLIPQGTGQYVVRVLTDEPMPFKPDEIAATLLDGRVWISWMDDRVLAAMRQLHGQPTDQLTRGLVGDII